jgi:tRNA-dihydrouridine synthase
MNTFWNKLQKPFTILAPMEGVTDVVFREIILSLGRPDVFFTEFTSVTGIMSKGREKVERSLKFTKKQKPIVAQIWGTNVEDYFNSAKYCKELGFDGIDINMGCPIDAVVKKGACAALIHNPKLAKEIIEAVKKGSGLPVSVKTRIGISSIEIDEWISFLLKQDLAALTIHLRTAEELSKVPAHWELMPKIISLRDSLSPKTLIIGNGDISSYSEVKEKYEKYLCDGFMIGRGALHDPWIFNKKINVNDITSTERLNLYIKHINLFLETWNKDKNPDSLKRFSKTWVNNFPDATELRDKINISRNTNEMIEIIEEYKKNI